MAIQLTPEQRQAVREGRPVEVHDPEDDLRAVMVSSDEFQRMRRSLSLELAEKPDLRPPVWLRDLTLPPDVQEHVQRRCRIRRFSSTVDRRRLEEEVKLQYFFGGLGVGYLVTESGRVVVAVGPWYGDELDRQLDSMGIAQRREVVLDCPARWNEVVSQHLGFSSDDTTNPVDRSPVG